MFRIITALSKTNKLSNIHPLEKITLALMPIIIMGFSKSLYPLIINIIIFMILHIKSKNQFNIVMKFTLVAGSFALLSSITIVFDYGFYYCSVIILKTISGGIALSFLALTTPLDDILYFVSRNEGLRDVCDITKNMERFLILIEDEYIIMYNSMKCRGGFERSSQKLKNIGKLAGLLFVNVMYSWNDIKNGINSRCYNGHMPYMKKDFDFSIKRFICIIIYVTLLIIIVYKV